MIAPSPSYLLLELARVKRENVKLRRDVRELRKQRDRWREEARNWKWGALHQPGRLSTESTGSYTGTAPRSSTGTAPCSS